MRSRPLVALVALVVAACNGRPRAWEIPVEGERVDERGEAIAEIELGAGAPEVQKGGVLQIPSRHTFDALVATLHQAKTRKGLKGVFVTFGVAPLGWARAHEVGAALEELRRKVPVVCHADAWDNGAYAAAARGCTVVAMSEGGEVELTGPATVIPYARELLVDKLKAQVDILQVGKFKGAAEPLTRDGPSEEYRASIEGALSAIRVGYQKALTERGVDGLVGTGPYTAKGAMEHKLVDLLADKQGARDETRKRAGIKHVEVVFGPGAGARHKLGLGDVLELLTLPQGESSARPHVRLVRLHGEIVLGAESGGLLGGPAGIVARKVVERAHALTDDPNVRAVVLRIDSPGGSALGSDLAWIALKALRDKKPLIVSVGELAASGGYYLASAANRIFAEPESIVGSVGVVGGKISFGGTFAQVGIHTASFGDKRAAQLMSMTEPWDDATRAQLLTTMQDIYGLFLRRIADGRGKRESDFQNAVEGRVFGGEKAKALGLIDDLGGLGDALAAAKTAARLPADAPVVVDETSSFFELLQGSDDANALTMTLAGALGGEAAALERWARVFIAASRGPGFAVVAMLPTPLLVR